MTMISKALIAGKTLLQTGFLDGDGGLCQPGEHVAACIEAVPPLACCATSPYLCSHSRAWAGGSTHVAIHHGLMADTWLNSTLTSRAYALARAQTYQGSGNCDRWFLCVLLFRGQRSRTWGMVWGSASEGFGREGVRVGSSTRRSLLHLAHAGGSVHTKPSVQSAHVDEQWRLSFR